jgi:hypothetical protein
MNSILSKSCIRCDFAQAPLRFRYTDQKTRVVESHLVALSTAHHEILVAWRLRTEAIDTSNSPGWRNYLLDEMHSLEILSDTFERPRPDYNPNDKHVLRVYCCVPRGAI